jgi:hypothetical protein
MKRFIFLSLLFLLFATFAIAQSEIKLKQYFEGKKVVVKIDMPATKDGVRVYPYKEQPLDYSEYGDRLKRNGISIREGESVMITKVKWSKDHVEFQLGGGGYGTFGDDTSPNVYVPKTEKSYREKRLEDDIKKETDPAKKREMKEELEDLKDDREREDARNQADAAEDRELKQQQIAEKALQGGSRFNIYFEKGTKPEAVTPKNIEDALEKFVDFQEPPSNEK